MQKHNSAKIGQASSAGKFQSERPRKQVASRLGSRQAIVSATKPGSDTTRKTISIPIASIVVPRESREIDRDGVRSLAMGIKENGLQVPIEVRRVKYKNKASSQWVLVAGNHRIEALKLLGKKFVEASVVKCSKDEARQRTIAENLFRSDLTVLQRAEYIVEWGQLCKGAQSEHPSRGGKQPHDTGVSRIARALGISRSEVWRAQKIAAIDPKAKAAAIAAELDDSKTNMLAIAKESKPKAQLAKVQELENKKSKKQESANEDTEELEEEESEKQAWAKKRATGTRGTKTSAKGGNGGQKTTPGQGKSTYDQMLALWNGSRTLKACWLKLSGPDQQKFIDEVMLGGL
jgi:ParB family chromosome partitioning protein